MCNFNIKIREQLATGEDSISFRASVGCWPGSIVRLSENRHYMLYTSTTWTGDSGSSVVLQDGTLAGIHTCTVNTLAAMKHHDPDTMPPAENRLGAVEASLSEMIEGKSSAGAVAVTCASFRHHVLAQT